MTDKPAGWMVFLGAGASAAMPTNIPAFDRLRDAILAGLGWTWDDTAEAFVHPPITRKPFPVRPFPKLTSSRLKARSAAPEVVFGTLHRFGIPFASQVEHMLLAPRPAFNAVHAVAAAVLMEGGAVWTPNIDVAIEDAYRLSAGDDARRVVIGERDRDGRRLEFRAEHVGGGVLFKLHGSADLSGSLAFTDLELLAPYSDAEIEVLGPLARGRRLVFYGYRGADTDLRSLIETCMDEASEVVWYEPVNEVRNYIRSSFRKTIRFDPAELPSPNDRDWEANIAATARAFVAAAEAAGLSRCSPELKAALEQIGERPTVKFKFDPPPAAIVQARLVERFGASGDERAALRAARLADLTHLHPKAVGPHLRWLASSSLYSESGLLGHVVSVAGRNPGLSVRLPGRLRTFVFDKGPAVLLRHGRYRSLHALSEAALGRPERSQPLRRGSDLYYRAHALRYLNRPDGARADLAEAAALLVDRRGSSDVERLAGVLLEEGINAISQARLPDAFKAADDLVNGPGRYAIGRWSGWGHWLWGMAHLYSLALADDSRSEWHLSQADTEFNQACADFKDSDLQTGLGDVYIGRLLRYRLQLALCPPEKEPEEVELSPRQEQDRLLLRADIALAAGDLDAASRHLDAVEQSKPSELTRWLARFGRAELLGRRSAATPALQGLRSEAQSVGASFLSAQADLGLTGAADTTLASGQRLVAVGHPRVLWLLT